MGRSTRLLVAELVQNLDGNSLHRAIKGSPFGGEMVDRRPGTWLGKAERSAESLADFDGAHSASSVLHRPVRSTVGTRRRSMNLLVPWEMMQRRRS